MVTWIGIIFEIIALYYLYYKKISLFAIFFVSLSYFLDCVDGHLARKYNQQTKLGDWLDHISDWITATGIVIIAFYNYGKYITKKEIAIALILGFF